MVSHGSTYQVLLFYLGETGLDKHSMRNTTCAVSSPGVSVWAGLILSGHWRAQGLSRSPSRSLSFSLPPEVPSSIPFLLLCTCSSPPALLSSDSEQRSFVLAKWCSSSARITYITGLSQRAPGTAAPARFVFSFLYWKQALKNEWWEFNQVSVREQESWRRVGGRRSTQVPSERRGGGGRGGVVETGETVPPGQGGERRRIVCFT